jgi:hypothetical protein
MSGMSRGSASLPITMGSTRPAICPSESVPAG